MRLRFKTKDGLECVRDCPEIAEPISRVFRFIYPEAYPDFDPKPPKWVGEARAYEFRGEVVAGIHTVHEI